MRVRDKLLICIIGPALCLSLPLLVSQFLGGTGLLIVVSVGLDLVQRIEAALLMRNQTGFLDSGEGGRAARIRSGRG